MREVAADFNRGLRFNHFAFDALQEASEDAMGKLLEVLPTFPPHFFAASSDDLYLTTTQNANYAAIHARRVSIMLRDVRLAWRGLNGCGRIK